MTDAKAPVEHEGEPVHDHDYSAKSPLVVFGHRVGLLLAGDKEPKGDVLEGTARLLDALDDATDDFLVAVGADHRVERTMQADLRALARRILGSSE
jgi:hypothetical protein